MAQNRKSEDASARVVPLRRKPGGGKCSVCGKPASETYRPFCSRRCADVDLGRWLKEDYRIPTAEGPSEDPADHEDEGRD